MECFYSMPPSCLWDFALPLFYSGFVFYSSRQRNRKVTIWARVQSLLGLKVVALVPPVMPFSAAYRTAVL